MRPALTLFRHPGEPGTPLFVASLSSRVERSSWRRSLKKTAAAVAAAETCSSDLSSAPFWLPWASSGFSCGTITKAAALPRPSSFPGRASKMGDRIIITDDEPKPAPDVIVVTKEEPKQKVEKVTTEKTTVVETKET